MSGIFAEKALGSTFVSGHITQISHIILAYQSYTYTNATPAFKRF